MARISNHESRFGSATAVSLQDLIGGCHDWCKLSRTRKCSSPMPPGLRSRGWGDAVGLGRSVMMGRHVGVRSSCPPEGFHSTRPRRRVARISNHESRFGSTTAVSLQGLMVGYHDRWELSLTGWRVSLEGSSGGWWSGAQHVHGIEVIRGRKASSFTSMCGSGGWNRWGPRDSSPPQMSASSMGVCASSPSLRSLSVSDAPHMSSSSSGGARGP